MAVPGTVEGRNIGPIETPQKPWRQLTFVLGEAGLSLVSSGVLFIIISRVSGPALLGTYALAFAWLMLFQGVSSFGIPEFIMREVGAHGRDAARQVNHAMLLGLGCGFVAIGLMLVASRSLGYPAPIVEAIAVVSLALIPAFFNGACRSVFLALREMHLSFLALLAEVTILMSASLYLLLSGHGAVALMISVVAAKTISASISLALLYGRVLPARPSVDLGFLRQTARTVFTFGIGNMLGMLTMRINTILVSVWVDIAAVGQFAAATKIMEIGLMIPSLFAQLLMTRIAYSFNTQGNRDPNRFGGWYQLLFSLLIPTCVGVGVFAKPILETLFGAGFEGALWVLRVLMIYLAIESVDALMGVILKAAHRQRDDVKCMAFNPLVNTVLSLALLPLLGTTGAAIGRVGGVIASATLRYLLIARELSEVNWFRFALKPAFIGMGVGSASYALLNVDHPFWPLVLYVAATAVLMRLSSSFSVSALKDMMSAPSGLG